MNLDERLEALRINIESLHSNVAQLVEAGQATDQRIDKMTAEVNKLTGHMAKLTQTMDRLANIVIRHEERLDSLDSSDQ